MGESGESDGVSSCATTPRVCPTAEPTLEAPPFVEATLETLPPIVVDAAGAGAGAGAGADCAGVYVEPETPPLVAADVEEACAAGWKLEELPSVAVDAAAAGEGGAAEGRLDSPEKLSPVTVDGLGA